LIGYPWNTLEEFEEIGISGKYNMSVSIRAKKTNNMICKAIWYVTDQDCIKNSIRVKRVYIIVEVVHIPVWFKQEDLRLKLLG